MNTEGLSRQAKRKQIRDAAKTIGKLNHILQNPAQTAGAAKMQNKNIRQYVGELERMGVIKPPPLHKRLKQHLKQLPRFARLALKAVKFYSGRARAAFDRFVDNHAI